MKNGMHALMLSTDRTVFERGSPARARMDAYAAALGKLSVIVFAKRSLGLKPDIGVALSLYPTNSFSRFSYMHDAERLAEALPRADVVSTQDPFETGLAGARIARRRGIPLHVQAHTDFLAPGFSSAHWPLNLARLFFARRVIRRAAGVRAVSARVKEHIEQAYHPNARVSVLPIFFDVGAFKNVPRARHPKFPVALLVVSRLEKEKRVAFAVRALKAARDAGFDAGLDIVGAGREEARLKKLACSLGLSAHVAFHGFQKELAPYYASADVLLYPGALYEGFGLAIVESLAAGTPVVAGDVGIAREAGAEVAAGDTAEDFCAALVSFLKKRAAGAAPPVLLHYAPYASKEEYLKAFADDLAAAARQTT